MGQISELDMDLQTITSIMGAPISAREVAEHSVAMSVYELMSATKTLSELAASKTNEPLVRRELNDIELAYTRLGRMLSRVRMERTHAA